MYDARQEPNEFVADSLQEARAKAAGIERLFVLTTRTAHFFIKRGFRPATVDDLPPTRQNMYNWQRRSQVLIKTI